VSGASGERFKRKRNIRIRERKEESAESL